MPATLCACLRGANLRLVVQDPLCLVKEHLWDEMQTFEDEQI